MDKNKNFANMRSPSILLRLFLGIILISVSVNTPIILAAQAHRSPTAITVELPALTEARVTQGRPYSACGSESYLAAGYEKPPSMNEGVIRSFIKFDLSQIPEGSTVSQASLNLYYIDFTGPLFGDYTISAARLLEPWAENSVQWSTAPAIASGVPITGTVNHALRNTWVSLDVTGVVQGWVQGQYPNYGIALLGPEEISDQSTVEFFESSDSFDPDHPQETLHLPHLEVTYQPQAAPGSPDDLPLSPAAFLPLVLANYPPLLDLHPIDNDGGEANYIITWTPHPNGYAQYELLEWTGNGWEVIFTTTPDKISFEVKDKPLGIYSYYLRATGDAWTESSLVRSVTVSDQPNQIIYLVIGVGDYQNMPSFYTLDSRLGNDLQYPVFDATDVQDMLQDYGYIDNQPADRVLALINRQATKAAIHSAITGWLDAREAANTAIFIYFAGHTLVQDFKPYLAPYDLSCGPCTNPSTSSTWLAASAISAEEINTWLADLASNRLILVFDSSESERWISELKEPDRTILAGSRIGEHRWEFPGLRNGAFSWYFNEAYVQSADQNQDSGISIAEAYTFSVPLYKYVYAQTSGAYQQHPVLHPGSYSQVNFINLASPQACEPLR